jgi:hypothetical protein
MANRELLEWLGITWADLLVYLVGAAIVAMFFVSSTLVDSILAGIGVTFVIAASLLGMKEDSALYDFTNCVKLVTYPLCVLLVLGAIAVHFVWFNK